MHAWTRQARVLNQIFNREPTDSYFLDPSHEDNLFNRSLQIDINDKPSRKTANAKAEAASVSRQAYLEEVFPTFTNAKVYWMNVKLDNKIMGPRRTRLAKIVLSMGQHEALPIDLNPAGGLLPEDAGKPTIIPVHQKTWPEHKTDVSGQKYIRVRWLERHGRIVLCTTGLSDSWSGEAERFVADLIKNYIR